MTNIVVLKYRNIFEKKVMCYVKLLFSSIETMKDEKESDEIISSRLNNRIFVLMLFRREGGRRRKKKSENLIVIQTHRCRKTQNEHVENFIKK